MSEATDTVSLETASEAAAATELAALPLSQVPDLVCIFEEASDALIDLMNKANKRQKEDILVYVEEKFERRLIEEISKVNERITKEVSTIRTDLISVRL